MTGEAGPFYIEIWGPEAIGKTHQSHANSPDPVTFDTASTSMDFGEYDIETNPDRKGESWDVIHKKVYEWDEEKAREHYRYITSYDQAIEELKSLEGAETVILDNWYDFRTLIIDHVVENYPDLTQNRGWPTDNGWGKVNDLYRRFSDTVLETGRHFVCISEMKDEYNEDGNKTGNRVRAGPSRSFHDADFRVELGTKQTESGEVRRAFVRKNRFLDQFGDEWVEELGSEYDFETLMAVSGLSGRV